VEVVPGAKLASAVAARGTDRSCDNAEEAERATAAIIAVPAGATEAEAKAALDKFISNTDGKSAQALKDYASKRLNHIAQHPVNSDFGWDF